MTAVLISEFGRPWEVATLTRAQADDPGPGEVAIAVEAAPINPSDLLMMRGLYGVRPELPRIFGSEGVGRVAALGDGVVHLAVGDRVLVPYGTPSWTTRTIAPAQWLFPLPEDADGLQLAMLGVNPPTACLLLEQFADLRPGDWVIHNAANSGVGRAVIAIARTKGLRTVNVVRRESAIAELTALGGDVVLVDGPELRRRVAAATDRASIALALEAVGGAASASLISTLAAGGTMVAYAGMSAEPMVLPQPGVIFRDQAVRGFWLDAWLRRAEPDVVADLYRRLVPLIATGAIHVPVEAVYPLEEHAAALSHAAKAAGKVLFTPSAGDRPA